MPTLTVSELTKSRIRDNTKPNVKDYGFCTNVIDGVRVKIDRRKRFDSEDDVVNRALDALEATKNV